MGLMVTLQHTKKLDDGRYRYRRRYPEDVREALGWEFIRTSADPLSNKAMHRWHLDREAELETEVRTARRLSALTTATDRELYEAAQVRAGQLLEGVDGLDEDDARATLAEHIATDYPEDPETGDRVGIGRADAAIIAALMDPKLSAPEPTMADAKRLYLSERVGNTTTERGRKNRSDTDRVFRLAEDALGDRAKLPLSKLADADARAVRDHMLKRTKAGKNGETIKASSVRRELNVLASAWKVALKGFDLNKGARAVNIFEGLNILQEGAQSQQDERDPLPYPVIEAMWIKLRTAREKEGGTLPQQRLIWRLLAGTGCRESEIAGLRVKDVNLAASIPHLKVTWHEDRRVKNRASLRSVPLVGDALAAATEAVSNAGNSKELFPAYYGNGGGNRLSAALMKHLRNVRMGDDPTKQVIHSLRHNMADWLRLARVETRTENLILGHALGGVGARVYGGSPADLELTHEAMKAAHQRAEQDMGTTISGVPLPPR
jgi:integrase